MKSKSLIIGNIFIFAIGLIITIISGHEGIFNSLLLVTGLLFIIPGVINIFVLLNKKERVSKPSTGRMVVGWVSSASAIILGTIIAAKPDAFVNTFLYIAGALLIIFAVALIYIMGVNLRKVNVSLWLYVLPMAILIDGIVIFCLKTDIGDQNTLALLLGLGLMAAPVSFFTALYSSWSYNRRMRQEQAEQAVATQSNQVVPTSPASTSVDEAIVKRD